MHWLIFHQNHFQSTEEAARLIITEDTTPPNKLMEDLVVRVGYCVK